MQDDDHGLVNRPPFKTDQRVATLSPTIDSWKGKQYAHNPAFAGDVPANNIGLIPEEREISDKEFHEWPDNPVHRHKQRHSGRNRKEVTE